MRQRLVVLAAATASMVAVAFVVPLALLVRDIARDRALTAGERDAQALAPVLALTGDTEAIRNATEALRTSDGRRITVFLADGRVIGAPSPADEAVALARSGRAFTTAADDHVALMHPVRLGDGTTAVVRVAIPERLLDRGVHASWAVLAAVGAALVLLAGLVADRIARSILRPVEALRRAAHRLGGGDLAARVAAEGPPEVAEVAVAFNRLAEQVVELLAAERELLADLSHRLRTPLTALRLDAEGLADPDAAARVVDDVRELELAVDGIIDEARRPDRVRSSGPTDLDAVVRARAAYWGALADEQGRRWSVDPAAGSPLDVHLPATDLEAAIDAIVGNVFDHTAEGTGFRIGLGRGPDGTVWVAVDDDGPGLPGEHVAARGESGRGSSGLGLDIVRRTAQSAGGSMRLGHSSTGGTRVELRFPVARPAG